MLLYININMYTYKDNYIVCVDLWSIALKMILPLYLTLEGLYQIYNLGKW